MASTLPPLLQATTGALGSAVGNAIVFPLDLATTRMHHSAKKVSLIKTLLRLVRRHGYARLYSGLSADTLSTFLSTFLYFLIYASLEKAAHQWRKRIRASSGAAEASSDILIGTIAGIASKRLSLPISAVCIRQQLGEEPESISETLQKMHKETGALGLFHIPIASASLALLPSFTLFFHNAILDRAPKLRDHPGATFFVAALSNALATLPLYPLILAKSQSLSGYSRDRSFLGPFKRIIQEEGVSGLYKGVEAQLLKGLVQQGVMMAIKQRLEQVVQIYTYKPNSSL